MADDHSAPTQKDSEETASLDPHFRFYLKTAGSTARVASPSIFLTTKPSTLERSQVMKTYSTQEIRNLGIVGHGDAGKTSLVAAMLFVAGTSPRLGKVDDGTAPTDFDE